MKVFVIDDSAMYRRAITEALRDPAIEVVGSAINGKMALDRLKNMPDVDLVTCDMEMPEMNGLEFIEQFRAINRTCKILVFSSLSERGAKITIDALLAGANDFLPKSFGKTEKAQDPVAALRENLLPKVLQFRNIVPSAKAQPEAKVVAPINKKPGAVFEKNAGFVVRPDVVCIGSSTGGPDALKALLTDIAPGFPVPILIAQHMPAMFTKELAKLLDRTCPLTVKEAEEGEEVKPGFVYIAPGDYHMRVRSLGGQKVLVMDQGEKVNFVRPAVDLLFNSVSDVYGKRTLALILTGMGQDGLDGVRYMKEQHNIPVIIQDKASCVVFGMPGAIHEHDLYDQMLPLNQIAGFINKYVTESMAIKERLGA